MIKEIDKEITLSNLFTASELEAITKEIFESLPVDETLMRMILNNK